MKNLTLISILTLFWTMVSCSTSETDQYQKEVELTDLMEELTSDIELEIRLVNDEYRWFPKDDTIPFTGTRTTRYSYYQIGSQEIFEDGELNGLALEYHPNGLLKSEGNYSKNMKTGLWKRWYQNGQLSGKVNYLNGKKNGVFKSWYESGKPMMITTFKNNKEQSGGQYWYENGQPLSIPEDSIITGTFEITTIESEL